MHNSGCVSNSIARYLSNGRIFMSSETNDFYASALIIQQFPKNVGFFGVSLRGGVFSSYEAGVLPDPCCSHYYKPGSLSEHP